LLTGYAGAGYTQGMRFRLSSMLGAVTVIALTLAFWSLNPGGSLALVPWPLLTLLFAIMLTTFIFIFIGALRRK
jgi:hypothetical protein